MCSEVPAPESVPPVTIPIRSPATRSPRRRRRRTTRPPVVPVELPANPHAPERVRAGARRGFSSSRG